MSRVKEKELEYFIKNKLSYMSVEKIFESLSSKEDYEMFLGMVSVLFNEDQLFLASFPKIIDHILEVINHKRFEYKTIGKVRLVENEIIILLNELKDFNTYECREQYRKFQSEIRMFPIKTDEELVCIVADDVYTIRSLENHNVSSIEKKKFLSSTAYLIETFPELYMENKEYIEQTLEYIKAPKKDEDPYIRKSTKVIQKSFKRYKKWKEKA